MKPISALFLAALGACGGSTAPTAPYMWGGTVTITAGTASTSCVSTATVVYSASGVSPSNVSIPVGGCVDFENHDTVAHWPESNPHPTHTDCPWLNMPSPIAAGGSTTVGPAPAPPMTCGFHDHLNPPPAG